MPADRCSSGRRLPCLFWSLTVAFPPAQWMLSKGTPPGRSTCFWSRLGTTLRSQVRRLRDNAEEPRPAFRSFMLLEWAPYTPLTANTGPSPSRDDFQGVCLRNRRKELCRNVPERFSLCMVSLSGSSAGKGCRHRGLHGGAEGSTFTRAVLFPPPTPPERDGLSRSCQLYYVCKQF